MGCSILVSEVGLRDGLQSIALRHAHCGENGVDSRAEAAAGVRELEVGSFVPRNCCRSSRTRERWCRFARTIPGFIVAALVPNLRGAQAAVEAGAHKMTLPCSVSETHSLRNVRRTHVQVLEEARGIADCCGRCRRERRPHFEGSLSTVFGCTLEGPIRRCAWRACEEALMAAGCDEVGLADTSGYADPAAVRHMIRLVRSAVGRPALTGIHLHNTRGLGLANTSAAVEEDITTFDSSLAGLGLSLRARRLGQHRDGRSMLHAGGDEFDTGIDLSALLRVREILARSLPGESLYGFTPEAGLPLGFPAAAAPTRK